MAAVHSSFVQLSQVNPSALSVSLNGLVPSFINSSTNATVIGNITSASSGLQGLGAQLTSIVANFANMGNQDLSNLRNIGSLLANYAAVYASGVSALLSGMNYTNSSSNFPAVQSALSGLLLHLSVSTSFLVTVEFTSLAFLQNSSLTTCSTNATPGLCVSSALNTTTLSSWLAADNATVFSFSQISSSVSQLLTTRYQTSTFSEFSCWNNSFIKLSNIFLSHLGQLVASTQVSLPLYFTAMRNLGFPDLNFCGTLNSLNSINQIDMSASSCSNSSNRTECVVYDRSLNLPWAGTLKFASSFASLSNSASGSLLLLTIGNPNASSPATANSVSQPVDPSCSATDPHAGNVCSWNIFSGSGTNITYDCPTPGWYCAPVSGQYICSVAGVGYANQGPQNGGLEFGCSMPWVASTGGVFYACGATNFTRCPWYCGASKYMNITNKNDPYASTTNCRPVPTGFYAPQWNNTLYPCPYPTGFPFPLYQWTGPGGSISAACDGQILVSQSQSGLAPDLSHNSTAYALTTNATFELWVLPNCSVGTPMSVAGALNLWNLLLLPLNSTNAQLNLTTFNQSSGVSTSMLSSTFQLSSSTLHHVAIIVGTSTVNFLVDGLPCGSALFTPPTLSSAFNSSLANFYLGQGGSNQGYFVGSLDNVHYYNSQVNPLWSGYFLTQTYLNASCDPHTHVVTSGVCSPNCLVFSGPNCSCPTGFEACQGSCQPLCPNTTMRLSNCQCGCDALSVGMWNLRYLTVASPTQSNNPSNFYLGGDGFLGLSEIRVYNSLGVSVVPVACTASSQMNTSNCSLAFDGLTSTMWLTSSPTGFGFITLDFGTTISVSRVLIFNYNLPGTPRGMNQVVISGDFALNSGMATFPLHSGSLVVPPLGGSVWVNSATQGLLLANRSLLPRSSLSILTCSPCNQSAGSMTSVSPQLQTENCQCANGFVRRRENCLGPLPAPSLTSSSNVVYGTASDSKFDSFFDSPVTIHYTLDYSVPTLNSSILPPTGIAFSVPGQVVTITAIAFQPGRPNSIESSLTFTVVVPPSGCCVDYGPSSPIFSAASVNTTAPLIKLNVGGTRYTTTSSTLVGPFFAQLLSTNSSALVDEEGCLFIDRDGWYFGLVLNYLRTGQITCSENQMQGLLNELEFYGIATPLDGFSSRKLAEYNASHAVQQQDPDLYTTIRSQVLSAIQLAAQNGLFTAVVFFQLSTAQQQSTLYPAAVNGISAELHRSGYSILPLNLSNSSTSPNLAISWSLPTQCECQQGSYSILPCTPDAGVVCFNCSLCSVGYYTLTACTGTTDATCVPCNPNFPNSTGCWSQPQSQVYSDSDCLNMGSSSMNLDSCILTCESEPGCTAVNSDGTTCILRQCAAGASPTGGFFASFLSYRNYGASARSSLVNSSTSLSVSNLLIAACSILSVLILSWASWRSLRSENSQSRNNSCSFALDIAQVNRITLEERRPDGAANTPQ
eukprot:gnl/Spiro4/10342_TR5523_c0_g1_i1.p1 gnl/Spiro4/10342_TR5523_c0_g1~~gnl/Spiro4/10342_TR5523_c0_g1_i1.p1  ORF type:complete len:1693 (+),score=54.88 gnl/Spiro4/10342_TR5523_c0_g1_i1:705-5081(+)